MTAKCLVRDMFFGSRVKSMCLCGVLLLAVATPVLADTIVQFETALGDFDVQFYDSIAPITVANFLNYVNDGDYVNSFFHRLVPGFVLQGGAFTYDPALEQFDSVPTDPPIANEFNISNTRGTLAMATMFGDPDSATSNFFFNLVDNSENLDNQNGGFTVFGEVIGNGMAVVDLLAAQSVWNVSSINPAWGGELPLINYSGSGPWEPTLEMVYSITEIPEPATLSLLALGGVALIRRKRE